MDWLWTILWWWCLASWVVGFGRCAWYFWFAETKEEYQDLLALMNKLLGPIAMTVFWVAFFLLMPVIAPVLWFLPDVMENKNK